MEKNRKAKGIVIALLTFVVISLTVAFAALSKKLTITSEAYLDPIKWGLKFQNISVSEVTDLVKEDIKTPTIDTSDPTKINGLEVTFTKPKQKVEYEVELVNESDVQVEIANINKQELSYKYIDFNVKYKDENKELEIGDVILPNTIYKLIIIVYYNDENITKETLPTSSINLNLSYEVNFVQSDKEANITTTTKASIMFPTVTSQLGYNVYVTYDNGNVSITGSGDIYENSNDFEYKKYCSFSSDDDLNNIHNKYCTLFEELGSLSVSKMNIESDKLQNALRYLVPTFMAGSTYSDIILDEDVVATKDMFKQYIIDWFSLTEDEASEIIDIIESIPKLKTISISEGITSLRFNLLGFIRINEISLPNSVNKIYPLFEYNLFSDSYINTVNLGNGMSSLPTGLFSDSHIKNIVIPSGIVQINKDVAFKTTDLEKIVNKTGKTFDWNGILGGTASTSFETGTVEVNGRTIIITK